MIDWVTKYWMEWLFGLVIALATGAYTRLSRRIKADHAKDLALEDGMQALLRDRIIESCDHYITKGYAPVYARESIESMYAAYHGLGGDGIVTDMVNRVMRLPYKVDEDAGAPGRVGGLLN